VVMVEFRAVAIVGYRSINGIIKGALELGNLHIVGLGFRLGLQTSDLRLTTGLGLGSRHVGLRLNKMRTHCIFENKYFDLYGCYCEWCSMEFWQ